MTRHLIVIGAQRCGTTYLHTLLDAHPAISMARPARPEPKVFLSAELTARGIDWYEATYFSHASSESLLGEKSTSYIECADAARRAASMLGNAEIIVVLRDPVARAVSNWQFSSENGFEDRPLAQALTENLEGARAWDTAATSVSPYAYLERGRYACFLEPWYEQFPESVHVCFFGELVMSQLELVRLYKGLAVDASFQPDGVGRPINSSRPTAPSLDSVLETRLREYFSDSDSMLGKLIDRKIPWSQL